MTGSADTAKGVMYCLLSKWEGVWGRVCVRFSLVGGWRIFLFSAFEVFFFCSFSACLFGGNGGPHGGHWVDFGAIWGAFWGHFCDF